MYIHFLYIAAIFVQPEISQSHKFSYSREVQDNRFDWISLNIYIKLTAYLSIQRVFAWENSQHISKKIQRLILQTESSLSHITLTKI